MSRDRNDQTESAGPNWPDRIGQTETAQTETAQTESARPNRPDRNCQTETARPKSPVPLRNSAICSSWRHGGSWNRHEQNNSVLILFPNHRTSSKLSCWWWLCVTFVKVLKNVISFETRKISNRCRLIKTFFLVLWQRWKSLLQTKEY